MEDENLFDLLQDISAKLGEVRVMFHRDSIIYSEIMRLEERLDTEISEIVKRNM